MRESIVEDYFAVTVQDHSEQLIPLTNGIMHVTHSSSADRYKPLACIGMPGRPLTYPSAKPLRQQLKEAFENGGTLSCHRKTFSLSLCGFFWKTADALMLSCFHGQTTGNSHAAVLLLCQQHHRDNWWHWWQREWSYADRTEGSEHASTETARQEKWDAIHGSNVPTTGGMTDAACIYIVSSNLFHLRSIKKKWDKL